MKAIANAKTAPNNRDSRGALDFSRLVARPGRSDHAARACLPFIHRTGSSRRWTVHAVPIHGRHRTGDIPGSDRNHAGVPDGRSRAPGSGPDGSLESARCAAPVICSRWRFCFRLQLWLFAFPESPWTDLFKVDILNCMGFAIAPDVGHGDLHHRRARTAVRRLGRGHRGRCRRWFRRSTGAGCRRDLRLLRPQLSVLRLLPVGCVHRVRTQHRQRSAAGQTGTHGSHHAVGHTRRTGAHCRRPVFFQCAVLALSQVRVLAE